jgi:hypothetical protein
MFRAVRSWWSGARGKVSARLFLFEFVVVVLGVLVAQGIADWSRHRTDVAQMEAARARWHSNAAQVRLATVEWQRAIPCFDQRMDEIMTTLAEGPIAPELAVRPAIRFPRVPALSEDDAIIAASVFGSTQVDDMNLLESLANRMNTTAIAISDEWGRIAVAASGNGAVSAADRSAARLAAADIQARLRSMELIAKFSGRAADRLNVGVKRDPDTFLATDCKTILAR